MSQLQNSSVRSFVFISMSAVAFSAILKVHHAAAEAPSKSSVGIRSTTFEAPFKACQGAFSSKARSSMLEPVGFNEESQFNQNGPTYKLTKQGGAKILFLRPIQTSTFQALPTPVSNRNGRSIHLPLTARLHQPLLHSEPFARRQGGHLLTSVKIRTENAEPIEHYVPGATTIAPSPVAGVFLVGTETGEIYTAAADPSIQPVPFLSTQHFTSRNRKQVDGLINPLFTNEETLRLLSLLRNPDDQSIDDLLNRPFPVDGTIVHIRFLPREIQGRRPMLEIGRRNFKNYAGTAGFDLEYMDLSTEQWSALTQNQPSRFRIAANKIATARARRPTILHQPPFITRRAPAYRAT